MKKETQSQRIVRRAEAGDFDDNFVIRISSRGFSLTRVNIKLDELKKVSNKIIDEIVETDIFAKLSEAKKSDS